MPKSYKHFLKKINPEKIKIDPKKPSCFFCLKQDVTFTEIKFNGYNFRSCIKCHSAYDIEKNRETFQGIMISHIEKLLSERERIIL